MVKMKMKNLIFNDLKFSKTEPLKFFKSLEAFDLGEDVIITDSESFQKEIENNL